jgi:hypothetical protein
MTAMMTASCPFEAAPWTPFVATAFKEPTHAQEMAYLKRELNRVLKLPLCGEEPVGRCYDPNDEHCRKCKTKGKWSSENAGA